VDKATSKSNGNGSKGQSKLRGKGPSGWPSKVPGRDSGVGRDNAAPRSQVRSSGA
jgi:hypothetical protein